MKIIITYYLKLQTVISYYIVVVLKMYAFENLPTHLHQWRSQAKGMAAVLRSLTVVFLMITEAAIPTARVGSP